MNWFSFWKQHSGLNKTVTAGLKSFVAAALIKSAAKIVENVLAGR